MGMRPTAAPSLGKMQLSNTYLHKKGRLNAELKCSETAAVFVSHRACSGSNTRIQGLTTATADVSLGSQLLECDV